MKRVAVRAGTLLSTAMIGGGFIALGLLQWLDGANTGAPFNPLAGIIFLYWVLTTPPAWWCMGTTVVGLVLLVITKMIEGAAPKKETP